MFLVPTSLIFFRASNRVQVFTPGLCPRFAGGIFVLELFLPAQYPMVPPKIRFLTKVFHPNVDILGRICLDILRDKWSPALHIRKVLLRLQALLSSPNPEEYFLDPVVADTWLTNEKTALKKGAHASFERGGMLWHVNCAWYVLGPDLRTVFVVSIASHAQNCFLTMECAFGDKRHVFPICSEKMDNSVRTTKD